MPTVISTWGSSTSNSYISLDDAATYINDYKLNSEVITWNKVDSGDREIALLRATQDIDNQYVYVGHRREVKQNLEFPRGLNIYDFPILAADPNISNETEVQRIMQVRIERACVEQAIEIINKAGDASDELHRARQNQGIRGYNESLGPVSEGYQYGAAGDFLVIHPKSYDYLKHYVTSPGLVRGGAFDSALR